MRHRHILRVSILAGMLCAAPALMAQNGQGGDNPSAQPTPAQEQGRGGRGGRGRAAAPPSPTKNLPFDAHDLSGFWRGGGSAAMGLGPNVPPMTAWAQAKYEANIPGLDGTGGRNRPLGNDPMMVCDPVGFPRIQTANGGYGIQIIQTPQEMVFLYDWFFTRRIIWTDGRQLPQDPEPRFYGYAVGHWDGDTFVVESNGYDGRSWLDGAGHPHSDEMTIEERYHREDHDTIEVTMMVTDPKAYTQPWVSTKAYLTWYPAATMAKEGSGWQDLREDVCVPSEETKYKDLVRDPAGGATPATPASDHK